MLTRGKALKTVQMTIEDTLLEDVDQLIEELGTTRSAFIRNALQAALKKHRKKLLERKHAEGYLMLENQGQLDEDQGDDW
jgi:metal-responsive CopG/Arc/MetJ family transcriptional regulator